MLKNWAKALREPQGERYLDSARGEALEPQLSQEAFFSTLPVPAAPRILIFDLDGTLIDSMQPYTDLFCEMLQAEYGVPAAVSLPVFTRLLGKGPGHSSTQS